MKKEIKPIKEKQVGENIDKQQGNGVLPCVSGSICCPLCGSINYEEYEELMYENGMDDPQYGGN